MEIGHVAAAVAVLATGFLVGVASRRWWALVVPFVIPAWLAAIGLAGLVFEDRSDCYEECRYHWAFFFAVVTLGPAAAFAASAAAGIAVGRHRRRRPTPRH